MDANAFFIISSFVVVVSVFFVVLLVFSTTKSKPSEIQNYVEVDKVDYQTLMFTLDSPYTTLEEAQKATDYFFRYYREWELTKLQKRRFLFALCLNNKVNSELILRTKRKMIALEPKMKKDIEVVVKRAVDLRYQP